MLIEGNDLDPFNDMLDVVNNHKHTVCRFGSHYTEIATIYSDTLIGCKAPPSQKIQTVFVDVTLNNADMSLNP